MPSKEQVMESLEGVLVPGVRRSLLQMNLVRNVTVADARVDIALASTAMNPGAREWLQAGVTEAVKGLGDVDEVAVGFVEAKAEELNQVRHVVAVMSGKGGVGKSLITSLIAVALARQGHEVGVLDADITGPSIPMMFGLSERPIGSDSGILPVLSRTGIEVMSINLLLPHEDDAVIWRGPLIANTLKQFWQDVLWGRLDYLLVDLPPGTADAPLTVMQSLPLSGVIIAFTPQELAAMVVRKAVQMTRKMDIPILGVVENMSYLVLPESGKRLEIFGRSKGEEMARAAEAPLLARLPIDPELARLCDEGNIERYDSGVFAELAERVMQALDIA